MCESVCVVEYVLFKKQAGVYLPQDFKPENTRQQVFWMASKSLISIKSSLN